MVTQRRRRIQPLRKTTTQSFKKRRTLKSKKDWKSRLIKFFIGLVLIIDLVLVFFILRQCSKPEVTEEVIQEQIVPLQLEVLNGCGVPGVAAKYTDYLRSKGFDIVKTDNYESFNVLKTVVIDRRGNRNNGVRVAEALGLEQERVLQEVNEAYLIDATVILGRDFSVLSSWQKMESQIVEY